LPDAVDHFLGLLLDALKSRNMVELHRLYEDTFNKISEKQYKNTKWPSIDTVSEQISSEPLFLNCYRELYYRHIYSRLAVQYQDRKGSWDNYCQLLDFIIDDLQDGEDEHTMSLALPPQWLWDLLDEFVYHYQTYCNFRTKAVKIQRDKEISQIKENPEVYETKKVLDYLQKLVKASLIEEYLSDPGNPSGRTGGAFTDESVRLLGYYSLMQLLRMHSLLGDYHLAMQTIEKIDFRAEVPLFYQIPACHVTLYYYMGFAYLMMRRYVDSIRAFGDILSFLSKTAGVNSLSYQYEAMAKKQDQMYALLLLAHSLSPRQLDEAIERYIRDKNADKQARLQRGEQLCFEELFSYACPKFVTGAPPDFDNCDNFNANEAHARQLNLFLHEVKQQQLLPRINAYMKLYTAISTAKLAALCEMDEEALRDQLMCVMHKTHQRVRNTGGVPLDGEQQSCSEVQFYLDGDMVHIDAKQEERPHSEVFLEHIIKYQDLLKKLGKQ